MEIGLISEIYCYLQRVGILGYVTAAGVVTQLSIQAIEDPNTPVEIYTNTDTTHTKKNTQTKHIDKSTQIKTCVKTNCQHRL